MKKLFQRGENIHIALSAFENARADHYDGMNALYSMVAQVPISEETSPEGLKRQINALTKQLSLLEVQPEQIFVLSDHNIIRIEFCAKDYQMVMTKGQYVGLLLEFADFLSNSNISDIRIHERFFDADPESSVKMFSDDMINFFPEFNSKCFGAEKNTPIEVINC